jgi:hypothetical protein
MATAGTSGSTAFPPAARIPARRAGLTPSIGPRKSTGQGSTGRVAEEQSGRRMGAAAMVAHRCSRRRDGEHGPRRGARASVDHREAVHIPGGAGGRVEGAVDERIELGRVAEPT